MQANYVQLCSHQFNVMKTREGQLSLLRQRPGRFCHLAKVCGRCGAAQPRLVEMSAGGLLKGQNWVAGATEVIDGSLLRDPGCSGSHL